MSPSHICVLLPVCNTVAQASKHQITMSPLFCQLHKPFFPWPACLQVRKPARDLPLGILGALGIVTACYMLMSAALVMMVPIGGLELGAPFAAAFRCVHACARVCLGGGRGCYCPGCQPEVVYFLPLTVGTAWVDFARIQCMSRSSLDTVSPLCVCLFVCAALWAWTGPATLWLLEPSWAL